MTRDEIIATLRAHEAELRAMGVTSIGLFGSVARGEAGPDSDVDLAVEFDRDNPPAWAGGGVFMELCRILDRPEDQLDMLSYPPQRPTLRATVDRDLLRAF